MHLGILAALLVVALVYSGLGALAGARRWETAVVAGWGVATGAATLAVTLSLADLPLVMLGLLAAGLLGLALELRRAAWPGAGTPMDGAVAGRVLALGVPLLLVVAPMDAAGWDDLSHWLPNLAYLCEHGHAPTLAEPNAWSEHAAYPFASALPGYAVFLVTGRLAEGAAVVWNVLMILAACACISRVLRDRLLSGGVGGAAAAGASLDWLAAAAGLLAGGLLCPSFVAKIAFSNMTDSPTGSVLAVAGALVLDWFYVPDGTARDRCRAAVCLGCCGAALIGLRQSNAALLGLMALPVLSLAALTPRGRAGWRDMALLAAAFAVPLVIRSLWGLYAAREIPGGGFTLLPLGAWRWTTLPATLRSILAVIRQHPGLFLLIGWLGVCVARRPGAGTGLARYAVGLAAAAVSAGNIAFLAFTYLAADFSLPEAAAAASFWRYMTQTGPLVVLGLAACAPAAWLTRVWPRALTGRRLGATAAALALVLPVVGFSALRYDLTSPLRGIRDTARDLERQLPPDAGVMLVDTLGNGFIALAMEYQLAVAQDSGARLAASRREIGQIASAEGLQAEALTAEQLGQFDYVWIASGQPALGRIVGQPLKPSCSYLVHREAGQFNILDAHPARVLMTSREAAAKLPAGGDPACHGL